MVYALVIAAGLFVSLGIAVNGLFLIPFCILLAYFKIEMIYFVLCMAILPGSAFIGQHAAASIVFAIMAYSFLIKEKLRVINFGIKDSLNFFVLLYFCWEFLELVLAGNYIDLSGAMKAATELIVLSGIFIIISSYVDREKRMSRLVIVMLVVAAAESILAIMQHYSGSFFFTPVNDLKDTFEFVPREILGYIFPSISIYAREARGTFGHWNVLGNYLTLFATLALALAINKKNDIKRNFFYGAFSVIIFTGLYFSYSRGSLLGALIAVLAIVFLENSLKGRIALVSAVAGISGLIAYYLKDNIMAYWNNTQELTIRMVYWKETMQNIFGSALVFLFGNHYFVATGQESITKAYGWTPLGHNSYITILESRGIIGLLLILSVIFLALKRFYAFYREAPSANLKYTSIGLFGAVLAFGISQLFDHKLAYFIDIRIFFFTIIALNVAMKRIISGGTANINEGPVSK